MNGLLQTPDDARNFILAGNAYFTIRSKITGTRYTYRVSEKQMNDDKILHFVSVLTGPENTSHYSFIGTIFDRKRYGHSIKSHISPNAPSVCAFVWFWNKLSNNQLHQNLEVWHEGKCGKCGRKLTTPESISTGLGPVCNAL